MGRIKNKQFAVIGLGRFGGSICKELHRMGHEVLAVDINEEKVNAYASYATHAVIANATEENELLSLGICNCCHRSKYSSEYADHPIIKGA